MNNQKIYILLFILFTVGSLNAQRGYFETGLSSAFFDDYVNSYGEDTLDGTYSKPVKPFIESGFRFNLYEKKIDIDFNLGASYNSYTIKTAFTAGNLKIPTTYKLSYFSLKTGLNFSLIKWKKFKAQVHVHISHDWLTYGKYNYREEVVNIYKDKTLDRTLFRFHRGLAIEYEISKNVSSYLNYNIANSFKEKNEEDFNGESYSFETKSLSIGVLININKCNN